MTYSVSAADIDAGVITHAAIARGTEDGVKIWLQIVGMLVVDYAGGLLAFHGPRADPLTLDFASGLSFLTPRQRAIAEETLPHLPEIDKAALTEFGFRQLIRGLELMRDATAATSV